MANSAGFSNKAALLVVATFVLQLCFFAPLSALSSNIGEFSVSYINIIIIYIILSLLLIVLLAGLVRITGGQYLLPLLTFFSAAAFLESRLFLRLAGHAPFDGSLIDWQALQWLAWLEVVVLAALAAFFALYRRRVQMLSTVSLFILLFLAAGLAHMVATHRAVLFPPGASKNAADAYFDGFSRLSGERDVVHIVPDQAQGALFHDILREDPGRYGQVFEGFTVFTQATGRYKSTYPSVLFYMTGESPEPEYDMVRSQPFTWRYIADTLDQVSIVTTLARNGFSTYGFQFHPGIFCRGEYTACTGTHDEVFGGVPIRSPARRLANAVTTGLDLGLFQATPVFLRKLVFDDGRWLVRRLSKGEPTHSGVLDLFVSGLRADADQPTYNYFHHAGAHAPLLFDRECNYLGPQKVNQENQREQAHCTLAQLQDLLQALKANGLYDQSMIVVHGDHGSPWLPENYPHTAGTVVPAALQGMASTLLMIKPPGASGPLRFSAAPASIGDVPATVAGALGLENVHKGVALFGDPPAASRERLYFDYAEASKTHNLQVLPDLARYRVRGDVFDERNWVLPNTAGNAGHPSQLRMDHPDFVAYTEGFSWLEQHATPVRWVDGKRAAVHLLPPAEGPLMLVFEARVPPLVEGQTMEVAVNGKTIARLDAEALKANRHLVPLADEVPRNEVLAIEFLMEKAVKPERDSRHLAILFSYVGLVPAD